MNLHKLWRESQLVREESANLISSTSIGNLELGEYFTKEILGDVKHLSFLLSRYKFITKMLRYKKGIKMLELGGNEAIGCLMFYQNLDMASYTEVDFDEKAIEWNNKNLNCLRNANFYNSDFFNCKEIEKEKYDAVISVDVIEHIPMSREEEFCTLMVDHLNENGCAIIGTPTSYMYEYAAPATKIAHINNYSQERLYNLLSRFFNDVFIFNMTDEVIHTGFDPMSCYVFALCCNKK